MQKMHLVQQIEHAGGEHLIGIIRLKRGQTDTVRKNRIEEYFLQNQPKPSVPVRENGLRRAMPAGL